MLFQAAIITPFLAALAAAAPAKNAKDDDFKIAIADSYTYWSGNGASWPSISQWGSWDDLWNANLPLMRQSCGWNGWGADNSESEINSIGNAIKSLSSETGVDSRFILAVMMQESKGCVRVVTTWNGVTNPGLMQSHNGSGSCTGVNPCPDYQISQMIRDGVAGTSSGDGLKQTYASASSDLGDSGSRAYYAAARKYNSGSVDYNDLGNAFSSVHCYASDVANRLTGWTLASTACW